MSSDKSNASNTNNAGNTNNANNASAEKILSECDALQHGHFLLTSGRHGDVYMQCAKVQQYPKHMEAIAKIIADKFKAVQKSQNESAEVDIVIAPAVGAIVLGYELARKLGAKAIFAERDQAQGGKMVLRRGFEIPKGAKVLAAEDVVTTGGSVLEIIDIVKENEGEILGVGLIADRTGGEIDLGTRVVAAYSKKIVSYTPEECPLCKAGTPIVKPGSRVV